MGDLFIGIDSGTQGTKVILLDRNERRIVSESYAPHRLIEGPSGRREQEPSWWIEACNHALRQVIGDSRRPPTDIRAIGVSAQQHGMTALDRSGAVVRPAKLWCDTETSGQAQALTRRLGGSTAVMDRIGTSIAAGYTASKILWLKENEPANYARMQTVLLPHDYINYWLTGEIKTECGDASGTAYFDIRTRRWSADVLNTIDDSGRLLSAVPPLIESHKAVGTVRSEVASRFGFSDNVIVSSGGGDNMMAAIGTGNVREGVVTASFGTSGTIYSFSTTPVTDHARGELAAFCSSDGNWLPLACTMNVTVATELMRHLLRFDVDTLNLKASSSPIGAGGLMLLPYFNGERTPALPSARATLYGMDSTNLTPENICRASMEGATFGLRYGLDVLKRCGVTPSEIRLVGGGAKSALWRQIAAGIFGCPVVRPQVSEAGAFGAALQALWCYSGESMTAIADAYVNLDESTRISPDRDSVERYAELYQKHLKLNETMKAMY